MFRFLAICITGVSLAATASAATIERAPFGTMADGRAVDIYTMTNDNGIQIRFLSYGGVVKEIQTPDRRGKLDNIVLGLDTLQQYESISATIHFGAIIGRYANRIGNAQFTLNGVTYHLEANNGPNTLHGGSNGFDRKLWDVSIVPVANGVGATLTYVSPDGEEHFPGTLKTIVTYTLTNDDAFRIDYEATTDKPTVVNYTNHSYFNLGGNGSGSVAGQMLLINADRFTPTDANATPTGEIVPVAGTPLDFREMTPIGARLRSSYEQLVLARGYDHNFVINRQGEGLAFAARAYDPGTGRLIDTFTTEPGIQVYTSNSLDGSVVGSSGTVYRQTEAFTLETQHFADGPNKPNFPTTVLNPGETFRSSTVFHFGTDAALPELTGTWPAPR
jgi:aldose 1-epimerase